MKAFIPAAGLGTRLRPITDKMPKALVPVGGRPLIDIVGKKLSESGYRDIVVNAHHFADMIVEYAKHPGFDADIQVSLETDALLNTGGGIRKAASLLKGCGSFLVHNVDILSNIDLDWMRSQVRSNALATLAVSERNTSRHLLFDADMRLVGWMNSSTGEVKGNADPARCRRLAFSGIHIISEEALGLMEGEKEKFSIIDFYLKHAAAHPIYGVIPEDFHMLDVGKIDSLAEADNFLSLYDL